MRPGPKPVTGHYALTQPEREYPHATRYVFRGACSCGWRAPVTNTKRENAVRAARRHVEEAR